MEHIDAMLNALFKDCEHDFDKMWAKEAESKGKTVEELEKYNEKWGVVLFCRGCSDLIHIVHSLEWKLAFNALLEEPPRRYTREELDKKIEEFYETRRV